MANDTTYSQLDTAQPAASMLSGRKPTKPPAKAKRRPTKHKTKSTREPGGVFARVGKAIAEMHALGVAQPTRYQAKSMAGYKPTQKAGFIKTIGLMRKERLVEYGSHNTETVCLTDQGKAKYAIGVTSPGNNKETLSRLLKMVTVKGDKGTKSNAICQFLSDGEVHKLEAVAEASGYDDKGTKSTGFVKQISNLVRLGIVERVGRSKALKLNQIARPFNVPDVDVIDLTGTSEE